MAKRLRAEHGVVAANLTITIAFALFAVIELTRTLLAANSIDERVKVIVGEVDPINTDLDQVAKLDETARMAEEIMAAAQPLTGQAGQIVDATASIDNTGSGSSARPRRSTARSRASTATSTASSAAWGPSTATLGGSTPS